MSAQLTIDDAPEVGDWNIYRRMTSSPYLGRLVQPTRWWLIWKFHMKPLSEFSSMPDPAQTLFCARLSTSPTNFHAFWRTNNSNPPTNNHSTG